MLYLYMSYCLISGTKPSHRPFSLIFSIGSQLRSQLLKAPTTETLWACGAHTRKTAPETPFLLDEWDPINSYALKFVP